jgi:RimJ/RimL family protein N-acetyltransferase
LELRPDDDAGLFELAEEARLGVHPPEHLPFQIPWTDAGPDERARAVLRWLWESRAALRPERWSVHFLVRLGGRVVGVQGVDAADFAIAREVDTGSWVGLRHQGRGIGTEMRAAVLLFAFDHLGATRARSAAFVDNAASRRISDKLGYREDGGLTTVRRGRRTDKVRFVLEPSAFARPPWTLRVRGAEACLPTLGAAPG